MRFSRRAAVGGLLSAPIVLGSSRFAFASEDLAHLFPNDRFYDPKGRELSFGELCQS